MNRISLKTQKIVVFVLLSAFAIAMLPNLKVSATGTITGRVFQDFNGNGTYDTVGTVALPAIDAGVAGVTVTAYDSGGVQRGSATTIAAGTYSLSATGTGPYRLEFTTLPSGYLPSARSTDSVTGGTATNSGSIVQFVNDGNTSNVNLAINSPLDYSQNNPLLATSAYKYGTSSGNTNAGVITYPYSSVGNSPTVTNNSQILTVGTTWGLAYKNSTKDLFVSAVARRLAGVGTQGLGGIYALNYTTAHSTI